MSAEAGEKTERPTPRRLTEAARKGDVLASRDLAAALVMLAGAGWLFACGPWFVGALSGAMREALAFGFADVRLFDPAALLGRMAVLVLPPLAGLAGLTLTAAIASSALLGSLGFRSQAFHFKAGRINPLSGMVRIFGRQGLVELIKSIAKVIGIGAVGWLAVSPQLHRMSGPVVMDVGMAAAQAGISLRWTVALLCAALAGVAMADVPAQFLQRRRRLTMSRQEVRDEHKQNEGSPEVKAQQRQRRYAILSRSTRQAVKEATVVLTNPTHFAVALRYQPGESGAPRVVARGRGATAEAIRDLAREAEVPLLRYPQLTRALYYTAREGDEIREDLYMAVAVVLAFLFNVDARRRAQPEVDVPPALRFDSDGRIES